MAVSLMSGGVGATLEEVRRVKAPKAQKRWYPISHGEMVDVVKNAIDQAGLTITEESYGLMGKGGEKFFGTFAVTSPQLQESNEAGTQTAPYRLMIGVRNSIDKSMAAGICFGARVMVCDNLCFSGEVTVMKKHTKGIMRVLPQAALQAVKQFPGFLERQDRLFKRLREVTPGNSPVEIVGTPTADGGMEYRIKAQAKPVDHILMEAYRLGVIPSSGIGQVYEVWKNPPHDEFKIASAWSLFNAFTEYLKKIQGENPEVAASRSIRLTGLFAKMYMPAV